jgi:hypothetical protein
VSSVAITLCVASQRVFIFVSVYFVINSVRKLLDTPSYKFGVIIKRSVPTVNEPPNLRYKSSQNDIHDKVKSRLNSGNVCYYSVQNLLSFRLVSKNLKIKIYKTVILPVVLYGCETWSLTLREEHRLRVFENSVEEDI